MKVLHSSDWHLGADFFQHSRLPEQVAFLGWLLDTLEEHAVDVLVVAGDIFDTTNPPAEALEAYYRFLASLQKRGIQAVIVGGNHDSPSRLDAPKDILKAAEITVVGGYSSARTGPLSTPEGLVVPLGQGKDVAAVICALPYLHDWKLGVREAGLGSSVALHELESAFQGVYRKMADLSEAAFPGHAILATGHLTCLPRSGENPSEEDAIPIPINRVGTLGAMGPSIFDERLSYVALGHIHRPMRLSTSREIWYSGSPVQVSSSEKPDARQVILIEDAESPKPKVSAIKVPVSRALLRISGAFEEVRKRLQNLEWAESQPPYIVVEAELSGERAHAQKEIMGLPVFQKRGAGLVHLQLRRPLQPSEQGGSAPPRGLDLSPESAFRYAWEKSYGEKEPPRDILSRFHSILQEDEDAP